MPNKLFNIGKPRIIDKHKFVFHIKWGVWNAEFSDFSHMYGGAEFGVGPVPVSRNYSYNKYLDPSP